MKGYPVLWDTGVFLPEQGLWLDPIRPRPRAVISHAHSDHVAAHDCAFVTPETHRLLNQRRPSLTRLVPLPYFQELDLGSARITLHPAGHVLGSAQTLVEAEFGSLLYTGDLKTRSSRTAAAALPLNADVLVLESTFGKPRCTFPDIAEVIEGVLSWSRETVGRGCVPVLLGYSLGKGQEILSALALDGLPVYLHPALFAVTEVYRELDCLFPYYRRLDEGPIERAIVVCPPQARHGRLLRAIPNARTAALTGWAMDGSLRERLAVDAVFPLSDHADFTELCAYAERVAPRMTYTVLGFDDDLALHLRRRGLRAAPLRQADQLSLF